MTTRRPAAEAGVIAPERYPDARAPSPSGALSAAASRRLALLLVASALLYGFRLGSSALGASEAYSALAAAAHTARGAIAVALAYDPGKPPLYHLLLHWFALCFGTSEVALRAFSVIWGVAAVALVWAVGLELFDQATALSAAAIWAANPIAYTLARWARMYSMFIALALLFMLLLLRARKRPSSARAALAMGFGTATLLYTHMLAILPLGAAVALLLRDAGQGRASRGPWIGLGIGLVLFAPFIPLDISESRHLLLGHWLDWIGNVPHYSTSVKVAALAFGGILALVLILSPTRATPRAESVRFCEIWLVLPIAALVCGGVVMRPMLEARYLAPAVPAAALLLAFALGRWGTRPRNLATFGLAAFFAATLVYYQPLQYSPWRDVASLVDHSSYRYPVIFESGVAIRHGAAGRHFLNSFPQGYFRVPFDYYCHASNPRFAIDPASSAAIQTVVNAARSAGGAWLVTSTARFRIANRLRANAKLILRLRLRNGYLRFYSLVPRVPR